MHGTEEETENSANCLWLVTNSKPCPNCKSPIQKNEGCNHMKCSKVHFGCCLIGLSTISEMIWSAEFSECLSCPVVLLTPLCCLIAVYNWYVVCVGHNVSSVLCTFSKKNLIDAPYSRATRASLYTLLTASDHVSSLMASCSSLLYALRVLGSHDIAELLRYI